MQLPMPTAVEVSNIGTKRRVTCAAAAAGVTSSAATRMIPIDSSEITIVRASSTSSMLSMSTTGSPDARATVGSNEANSSGAKVPGDGHEHDRGESEIDPQVARLDAEDVAEEEVLKVDGRRAHAAHQKDAERKHAGEQDADRRIERDPPAAVDVADAQRGAAPRRPPPRVRS